MIALYTETFEDFLTREETSTAWQNIKSSFGAFPNFNIAGTNLSMYDLFVDKYELREIGSETPSIFVHNINDKLNECKLKFLPKIKLFLDNYSNLMERKVSLDVDIDKEKTGTIGDSFTGTLEKDGNITSNTDVDDYDQLYPISSTSVNKTANKSVIDNDTTTTIDTTDTTRNSNTKTFNTNDNEAGSREQQLYVFKSTPEILQKAFELKDIYYQCLDSFETCFMGIY